MPKKKNKQKIINSLLYKNVYLLFLLLILLLALGVSFIRNNNAVENSPTDSHQVANTPQKSEDFYSISLPEGWRKIHETIYNETGSIRYENNDGDYFDVEINPRGRGFTSDQTWQVIPVENEKRLKIDSKTICEVNTPFCARGDGVLNIGIKMADSISTQNIRSNYYFFGAGNINREDVDTSEYEQILLSIEFK